MPIGALGTYTCQKLQQDMVDYYQKNLPQFRTMGSTSLIRWLLSPQNTRTFKQISDGIKPIPGKLRGIAFRVETPFCLELCSVAVNCTTERVTLSTSTQEAVFDLTGDPYRVCDGSGDPKLLTFTEDEMMRYCTESDQTYMKNKITRYLMEWEEALDKVLTTLIATVYGHNGADEALTSLPFFVNNSTTNTSALNPDTQWYLNQLYLDMGLEGQFALIGGALVNKLNQYNKWKGLNDAGVDMSKADPTNPYTFFDRNFPAQFGAKDMLLLAPGAVQLVTWNRFKGEFAKEINNLYTHNTVVLPDSGLEVDYEWYFDYKCKVWTFDPYLHFELVAALPGGCGANMANVNGIIRITDCSTQPIVPPCPEPVGG